MLRLLILVSAAAAAYLWLPHEEWRRYLPAAVPTASAHARYAATIRTRGLDSTALGRAWLEGGDAALDSATAVRLPVTAAPVFGDLERVATAWRFDARRGHRIRVTAADGSRVFLDLFTAERENVASVDAGARELTYVVAEDGPLILRVQPELLESGAVQIEQRAEAALAFPVGGRGARAVGSVWGDPRDGGGRRHEGIDIFAPQGTPAVAAVDGWITGAATNRLGGNVVWLWSPAHGMSLYYAHLDRHAVARGDRVSAGDVLGYVGTTGNARGTPPHLHFGIYARGEGAIDPLPWVCDPPCRRR